MSNETNWLKDLPPFQPDEDPQRAERVQTRVLQKLDGPVESEEIAMKPKMTFHRIRPLIFAAAAVAVGAVSLITANAATGGELFSKLSIYLNGEKQDYDVELVSQDDSQLTYKIKDESGNEYTYQENSNSVEIQADGDVADPHNRQDITAAGSGSKAAIAAERFRSANDIL